MAVTYTADPSGITPGTYYSTVTGQNYSDADSAHAAEQNTVNPLPTGYPTSQQADEAATEARANSQVAKWDPLTNSYGYTNMDPAAAMANKLDLAANPVGATAGPANPNGDSMATVDAITAKYGQQYGSAAPTMAPRAAFGAVQTPTSARSVAGDTTQPLTSVAATGVTPGQVEAINRTSATPLPPTRAGAPSLDTSKSDQSVTGVNNAIAELMANANAPTQQSVAEAQLKQSNDLANLRAADELRNSQSAALGAARGARNRGDTALLERQAVGESAYLGTKAQQEDVLRNTATNDQLSVLRAQEEVDQQKRRDDLIAKAGELGLNVAALQVDTSKANLASANNYLNDQFQQLGIDKQIKQSEMGQVLQFTQAMAGIQQQYDAMSNADQQHTLDLMMQQYGIDQSAALALKEIKENRKINWNQLLVGMVGGAAQGGVGLIGKAAHVGA